MALRGLCSLATVCLLSVAATAQQMPGMTMPQQTPAKKAPAQKQQGSKLPAAPQPSMPGMSMPGMQGMHSDVPVAQTAGSDSVTHDTLGLQEPEHPEQHTGSRLTVPDLLVAVRARPPLALADLLAQAERLNPTLAQAEAIQQRTAAQGRQAALYPNPTVGYEGDQIRGGTYGGGEQGAFVQQTVVLGGKLGLRRDVFAKQSAADRLSAEEQHLRVHHDVTEAFYDALAAQETVAVRHRLLAVAEDAVETVHQLANVGQADAPDILQAEVEAEQAGIEDVAAQRGFLRASAALSVVVGRRDLPVSPLEGRLDAPPEVDAEAKVRQATEDSPEVKRAQAEVAVSEARQKAARREATPDLQLRAGEQYSFEHLTDVPVRPVGPQSFASAGVELPLWNRNQGNIHAAEVEAQQARSEVQRAELAVSQRMEPLAQNYLQARFTAERYRTELIPRAQRAYQLYLAKYGSMAAAYPQVLVSQRTLFELQVRYVQALREQWTDAAALESFGLRGGLQRATGTMEDAGSRPRE